MSNIKVELQLADGSFTSGMLRAGQTLQEFNQQLLRTHPNLAVMANASGSIVTGIARADVQTKGFLGTLRDVSIVTGLVSMGLGAVSRTANGFVGEIVKVNAEMERLRFQMQAMSTAKDPLADANRSVAYLREQAKNMPFSLKTITNSFVKLRTTGMDPMNGSLRALADGIAAFGGDDQAFNRVTLAITQMSGKSVIQMEEMRQQLGESMPAAMEIMARSMGVSVAQLTKAISTGRVEAKPALEAFFAELERSYGGEAQRMMQTFSGQVSQLATNLQNLATNDGGRGFFDQVKAQLVDINEFLQSGRAQRFAADMGQGLAQVIGWLRSAVSAVYEFRNEILNTGIAIGTAFTGLAIIRGVRSIVDAFGSLSNGMKLVQASYQATAIAQSSYLIAVNSGAPALVRLRTAMGLAAAAAGTLSTAISVAAPWVAAIGLAVYTTGNYFGWFSNKTREAYEEIKNFGAESRKAAQEAIENRRRQLEASIPNMDAMRSIAPQNRDFWDKKIADAKAELAKLNADAADIVRMSGEREDEAAKRKIERQLQDKIASIQTSYREEMQLAQTHFNELAKNEADNGRTAVQVEENRKKKILEIEQDRSKKILKIYDDQITALQERRKAADADEAKSLGTMIDNVRAMWLQENSNLQNLKMPTGVQLMNKPIDDTSNIKNGETARDRLLDDIAKIRAQLSGASGAASEMWAQIQRGEYGQIDGATEATKKLHQELMAATAEKEALDDLLKGQKKAEQDLANLKESVLKKEFELKKKLAGGDDMTEAEEMALKLKEGFYAGLGPAEKIRQSIMGVTKMLTLQGEALDQTGLVMRENAFGDQSGQAIDATTEKLRTMYGVIGQIQSGVGGIDFSNMGASIGGVQMPQWVTSIGQAVTQAAGKVFGGANLMSRDMARWGDPRKPGWSQANITTVQAANGMTVDVHKEAASAFKGFIDDLLGQGYNIKSLGGYNLRNKRNRNSLSEHAFGNAIDINPRQNPMGPNLVTDMPKNISALAAKWGLSWGGDWRSVKDAMHFEWRGGSAKQGSAPAANANVPASAGMPALPTFGSVALQEKMNALQKEGEERTARLSQEVEKLNEREKAANDGMDVVKRNEEVKKLTESTKALSSETEKLGSHEKKYIDAISAGQFGKNRNPQAAEYKELLAAARKRDEVEKQLAETKKNTTAADRDHKKLEEQRLEINSQIAEQQKLAKNPDYKPESSQLRRLRTQLDDYVENVKKAYGDDSSAYKQALSYKSQMLGQQTQLDLTTQRAGMNAQTREIETGLLTQSQQRQVALQRDLAELDRRKALEIQAAQQAGQSTLQITEDYEKAKAAVRAKYAQETSPIGKQMAEWSDLQSQLAQNSTKWMDSLAGGLTDLIMGTGDLKSVIQGILKDIVNMGLKYLMGSMMQGKNGAANAAGSKGSKGGAGAGKFGKSQAGIASAGKAVGLFHSGGVIGGSPTGHKIASSAAFMNAPRFHTGGIIGDSLLPSEVPIIAQKGEGVFTPEQMSALGGFSSNQQFNISAPVTVNGSAGTPEQNNDLAKKMARQMEQSMKGMIASEIKKQSRPGNFLNQRSR